MNNRDDGDIISDYLNGNEDSLREIISKYIESVYRFSYRLTGNKNDSEDITQDIFIKVWKYLNRYDRKFSFKTWLFTIARNTIYDYLRKKKDILFSDILRGDGEYDFEDNINDENIDIEAELITCEDAEELRAEIKNLPSEEKEILSLHIEEKLTFDEISGILKKPLNTVKSRYRRIVLKLKKRIAPKE